MKGAEFEQCVVKIPDLVVKWDGECGRSDQVMTVSRSGQVGVVLVGRSVMRGDVIELEDPESQTSKFLMVTTKSRDGLSVGVQEVPKEEVMPHRDMPIGKGRVPWHTVWAKPLHPVEEIL